MTKTTDFNETMLDDAALEIAVGGVKDGCIPGHPMPPQWPIVTGPIVLKDPFAIPTLGTYH